jgi:hypothetical protein
MPGGAPGPNSQEQDRSGRLWRRRRCMSRGNRLSGRGGPRLYQGRPRHERGTVPAHQARQSHHRPPLGAQTICRIVKDHAAKLGLDPKQYGAHSMRAGFLTSAAAKGANLFKMMDVSRHKSVDTLKGYVRSADAFRDHAGAGLL